MSLVPKAAGAIKAVSAVYDVGGNLVVPLIIDTKQDYSKMSTTKSVLEGAKNFGVSMAVYQFIDLLSLTDGNSVEVAEGVSIDIDKFIDDERAKLHKRLIYLSQYILNIQNICKRISQIPLMASMFPHLNAFPTTQRETKGKEESSTEGICNWATYCINYVKKYFKHLYVDSDNQINPASFENFLKRLNTDTFLREPSSSEFMGRLYSVAHLMYKHKEKLEGVMLEIAELDAYAAAAGLMKQGKEELGAFEARSDVTGLSCNLTQAFCFPEYRQPVDGRPYVYLKDFWNLALKKDMQADAIETSKQTPTKKIITNTLGVGKGEKGKIDRKADHPSTIIITGPNGGGKSTALKSYIMGIILAQSLAIAPASEMIMTPFQHIKAYVNITDDIASSKSLFQAACARALELLKTSKESPDGLTLLGFDEVFVGTEERDAEAAAYVLFKKFMNDPHVVCVSTTHLKKVRELEQLDPQKCANYKVTVTFENGKISPNYKLLKGSGDQNIAPYVLAETGFDQDFIQEMKVIRDKMP